MREIIKFPYNIVYSFRQFLIDTPGENFLKNAPFSLLKIIGVASKKNKMFK